MRVLVVTGGHRVDLDAFLGMVGTICSERGWVFAHAVQPAAQGWLTPEQADAFDVVLCHDIPGLLLKRGTEPTAVGPDDATQAALRAFVERGAGLVFLHHALAGWPGWDEWAEVLGGRYHYAPGSLRGEAWPDSGFRYAHYTARPEPHPITDGLEPFELDDELYRCPVFADDVVPLLRATDVSPGEFRETYHEVLGTPGPRWSHPPASDLIGWVSRAGAVYLQPGDGPDTFANPHFRTLLGNALEWAATTTREGHAWISS